jgi:hypothetical protein
MESALTREQVGQVATGDRTVLTAMLNKETGQSRLNQSVLIPMGVMVNEGAHRLQERLGYLRHQAHRSVVVSMSFPTFPAISTLPSAPDHQQCSPMPHHFSTGWSQSQL